jgi:hypothetical protein
MLYKNMVFYKEHNNILVISQFTITEDHENFWKICVLMIFYFKVDWNLKNLL